MNEQFSRHELESRLVRKLWSDNSFREEFRTNPKEFIIKHFDASPDSTPNIILHDEPAGEWHIVIPNKSPQAVELTDAELEAVAGGTVSTVIEATVDSVTFSIDLTHQLTNESGW